MKIKIIPITLLLLAAWTTGRAKPVDFYIQKAIENSPQLKKQKHKATEAKYRHYNESMFQSNPIFSFGYLNSPVSTFPSLDQHAMSGMSFSLSQKIALPWEDHYRKKVSSELYLSEKEKYIDNMNLLKKNIKILYHHLNFLYEKENLLKKNNQALKDIIRVARALVSVNKMNSSQLLKLEADLSILENEILEAGAFVKKTQSEMEHLCGVALNWGTQQPNKWLIKSSGIRVPVSFDIKIHPYYKKAVSAVSAARANQSHEKAKFFPSITLSGTYTKRQEITGKDTGEDFLSFKASAPLPLFHSVKEKHSISASTEKLKIARENLREIEIYLQTNWKGEKILAQNLLISYNKFEFEIMPKYLASYQAQLRSLPSGTVTLLDVLDAYRMYLNASIKNIIVYKNLQQSIARMQYLGNNSENQDH